MLSDDPQLNGEFDSSINSELDRLAHPRSTSQLAYQHCFRWTSNHSQSSLMRVYEHRLQQSSFATITPESRRNP